MLDMRYFLSILAVVVLVVITIIIIANSAGHRKSNLTPQVSLSNYSYAGTYVSQTTNGILTNEDQRTAIKITVSQASRQLDILSGYEQNVTSSETFPNTPAAYNVFLQGIQQAGFTKSRKTTETNMFAVCPLGNTYQYVLNSPTATVSNLWSTSCFLTDGTFNGSGVLVRQLFQLQIPNFTAFTQNLTSINSSYTAFL